MALLLASKAALYPVSVMGQLAMAVFSVKLRDTATPLELLLKMMVAP